MISVEFFYDDKNTNIKKINGFSIKGHAEDATLGESLICAAVSAISQTTVNGLSEIARANINQLVVEDGNMFVLLGENDDEDHEFAAQVLLKNLKLGLESLAYETPDDIEIKT